MTISAPLIAGGALCLLVSGGSAALLGRKMRRLRREYDTRVDRALSRYRASTDDKGVRRSGRDGRLSPKAFHGLFGYRASRRRHYRLTFERLLLVAAGLGLVAGAVGCHLLGTIGWLAGIAAFFFLPRLYLRRCDRTYSDNLFKQFPDALGMIVRAVRVGVPVGNAVAVVAREARAPTADEFKDVAEAVAIGRPLTEALVAMAERNSLTEYRFFATALSLQSRAGGGLTETLEILADTIRKRVAAKQRGAALASEARTSCYVLGALPFVVGGMLFLINPGYMSVLITTTSGNRLLALAAASLGIGLFLMNWISKRVLR